jgi:hypothetical protein
MMDENTIKDLLPVYIQGELGQEDSRVVECALAASPKLAAEYERLAAYFNALKGLPPVNTPTDFLASVNRRIGRPSLLRRVANHLFLPLHWKMPIELIGVAVCGLLLLILFRPDFERTFPIEKQVAIAPQADRESEPAKHQANKPATAGEIPACPTQQTQQPEPPAAKAKQRVQSEEKAVSMNLAQKAAKDEAGGTTGRDDHGFTPAPLTSALKVQVSKATVLPQEHEIADHIASGAEGYGTAELPMPSPAAGAMPSSSSSDDKRMVDELETMPAITLSMVIEQRRQRSAYSDDSAKPKAVASRTYARHDSEAKKAMKAESYPPEGAQSARIPKSKADQSFSTVEKIINRHHGTFSVIQGSSQIMTYAIILDRSEVAGLVRDLRSAGRVDADVRSSDIPSAIDTVKLRLEVRAE